MPSPFCTTGNVMDMSASLQNDTAKTQYTFEAQLPYLNMAMRNLQTIFELNTVPVTSETSAVIEVDAGVSAIVNIIDGSPNYPQDLIEIQQLWQRTRGINPFIPIAKTSNYLLHYLEGQETSQILGWSWMSQEIRFLPSNTDLDVKIDYIRNLFPRYTNADGNDAINIMNVENYLGFSVAALCSEFIGANESRAAAQQTLAERELENSLGISAKGMQTIVTRRRPFRASYKSRSSI